MSQIDALLLKTKKEVFNTSVGAFNSLFHGSGYDFSELKEYEYGDDAKRIDWLASAKMQTPYVKVMHEEKEKNILLVNLLGGSLYAGTQKLKIDTFQELAMLLGYAALKEGNLLSHATFFNGTLKRNFPSKELHSVHAFAKELQGCDITGSTSDFSTLPTLFNTLHTKSLVIFIGDFIEAVDLSLFAQRHDVVALVVRDSFERNDPVYIDAVLKDNENSAFKNIHFTKKSIHTYQQNIEQAHQKNYLHFHKYGIDYQECYDDDNLFLTLQAFFNNR